MTENRNHKPRPMSRRARKQLPLASRLPVARVRVAPDEVYAESPRLVENDRQSDAAARRAENEWVATWERDRRNARLAAAAARRAARTAK